jgi:DNA-binding transcriptional regulator YhcF (GntR family)
LEINWNICLQFATFIGLSTTPPASLDREHSFRKIADGMRESIIAGAYDSGARLPSTGELAIQYKVSASTIHKALVGLTKEGWLERINGAGTFVSRERRPFSCGGIYHGADISSNNHPAFHRNLHTALLAAFARRGKATEVFTDTRPNEEQVQLLPALQKAVAQHRIQALIAPNIYIGSLPTFERINLPLAFIDPLFPLRVSFDEASLFRSSMDHFIARNCHSVGFLTTIWEKDAPLPQSFREHARRSALSTRDEWILHPGFAVGETNADIFGYLEFMQFWKLPNKPDGLIVYPDASMRGVIAAILELGWEKVVSRLKLILHRNAHTNHLCPFPAFWAVSNEDQWAEALIQMVEDQYAGRGVTSVSLPFEFIENVPPQLTADGQRLESLRESQRGT